MRPRFCLCSACAMCVNANACSSVCLYRRKDATDIESKWEEHSAQVANHVNVLVDLLGHARSRAGEAEDELHQVLLCLLGCMRSLEAALINAPRPNPLH